MAQGWIGTLMPLLLLLAGLPLAFLATGLRLQPMLRGAGEHSGQRVRVGSRIRMLKLPSFARTEPSFRRKAHHRDYEHDDEDDYEHDDARRGRRRRRPMR